MQTYKVTVDEEKTIRWYNDKNQILNIQLGVKENVIWILTSGTRDSNPGWDSNPLRER